MNMSFHIVEKCRKLSLMSHVDDDEERSTKSLKMLDCDLVIVDECSMVDASLMSALTR